MAKRRKMSRRKAKRTFRSGTGISSKNTRTGGVRGGYRL